MKTDHFDPMERQLSLALDALLNVLDFYREQKRKAEADKPVDPERGRSLFQQMRENLNQ